MIEALTVDVVDSADEGTDSVELPVEAFNAPLNIPLVHQVVVGRLAAVRQGTYTIKTRGDVHGGGRKPYRQKGTGCVRQGSTRAPQFVGGGTIHGPQPRDYSQRTPKKMRAAVLRSVLSDHARNGRVRVITRFITTTVPSAKNALVTLCDLTDRKALVIMDRQGDLSRLSLRNAPEAYVLWADRLSTYDILKFDDVIFTASNLNAFLGKGEEEPK